MTLLEKNRTYLKYGNVPMRIQFFGAFDGVLGSNDIYSSISNMIISQEQFVDNIAGAFAQLVEMAKVDGSLYGDRKLYYATDTLKSKAWGADEEATNLLKTYRPNPPKCQEIVLDVFRQIPLTLDNYLSKRAWEDEGAFTTFNNVMLGWINNTKKIYEATTYNAFVGTDETDKGKQKISITLPTNADAEAQARLQGQTIAQAIADLIIELKDISRDFNDYGFLRSYEIDDLLFICNSKFVNKVNMIDLPTIFHNEQLKDKIGQYVLPSRYFGKPNAGGGTTTSPNKTIRALVEMDFNTAELGKPGYDPKKHVFAGDLLPDNQKYSENTTYTVDETILFKVIHKKSIPFMAAFETATSFFNAKSLTENHYLTWGHNTLEHLYNYPLITVRGTEGA